MNKFTKYFLTFILIISISWLSPLQASESEDAICEFDKPLTDVFYIFRWYDTWEELNEHYQLVIEVGDVSEVWGWSRCSWDVPKNKAICQVHVVIPEKVDNDFFMEVLGHEIFHGACGHFHE